MTEDFVPGGAPDPTPTPVWRAQGGGLTAALTFDDGPDPVTTPALLDFLAAHGVRATFCVVGTGITAPGGAALLRRIVADGHTLGNHSTDFDDLGALPAAEIERRMKATLDVIRTALGDPEAVVPFFRAPNGSWGPSPAVAVALGMQPLAVVNTIGDWETQDVDTLTADLRTAMRAGEVVLAHDGGGDRSGTLAAVRTVVSERLAAGWTFSLPVGAPAPGGETVPDSHSDTGNPAPGSALAHGDGETG
ncbi:MAG: polysaccharide deacetylase family protein [Leifsonia sp.]